MSPEPHPLGQGLGFETKFEIAIDMLQLEHPMTLHKTVDPAYPS